MTGCGHIVISGYPRTWVSDWWWHFCYTTLQHTSYNLYAWCHNVTSLAYRNYLKVCKKQRN